MTLPAFLYAWGSRAALLLALALAGAAPAGAADAPLIGAYLWGGQLDRGQGLERFHASVDFLMKQGFHAIRIPMTENSLDEIGIDRTRCGAGADTACFLRQALDSPAFDAPGLRLLMITLHESASKGVLADGLTPERRQAITAELTGVLETLQHRFAGRSVEIVLSNWEGDNQVYCGSVVRYARQPAFTASCDTPTGDGLDRRLAHFVDWMQLRDAVVQTFRAAHPGFDVEHAPEFNLAYLGPRNCKTRCDVSRTVFAALARAGKRPLCSFSSYNSTNRGALQDDLPRLLATCDRVILGELGFAPARQGPERVRQGFAKAAAAAAAFPGKVPAMVIWNAFDQPGRTREDSFGLYREDGTPGNVVNLPAGMAPGAAP
ncbi:hypothetical protein [Labrys wisconsinensis]|uniref:Cellulase (Glycosyl hydrolase family 5) n=1 Tax=Labrys wisconsinensis TaxID=425677 RepID=A0ABU0JCB6_9HYPH|nr:hypothetical protein [Labrys wisconsinensis]MDQ0471921.1 hypothetical protein [Labrys wisconsinensis]